jgi:hypothetical protein
MMGAEFGSVTDQFYLYLALFNLAYLRLLIA